MVYICSVDGCRSNYPEATEVTPVFGFPPDEDLCQRWINFTAGTRKDWVLTSSARVCKKHFEPKYVRVSDENGRDRLIRKLKPVPTILDPDSRAVECGYRGYRRYREANDLKGKKGPKGKFSILTISAYRVSTIEIYQDLVTEREVTQMNEVKRRKSVYY